MFQPSIIGLECAGLTEALKNMITQLPRDKISRICNNIVILGGNTMIPGFEERIKSEIQMLIYEDTPLNIVKTYEDTDKMLQPWLGAAKLVNKWQKDGDMDKYTISKKEYQECGTEYFKEHFASNVKYDV